MMAQCNMSCCHLRLYLPDIYHLLLVRMSNKEVKLYMPFVSQALKHLTSFL